MKTIKTNFVYVAAFLLGSSLAVFACSKKEETEETDEAAATGAAALVLQINANCDGSPCF